MPWFVPGELDVAFVVAGFADFAASEDSRCCRCASRNAAEMSRVRSVIDWRSRKHAPSVLLPRVGLRVWVPPKARKASMAHKLSKDLGLDFDTSHGRSL